MYQRDHWLDARCGAGDMFVVLFSSRAGRLVERARCAGRRDHRPARAYQLRAAGYACSSRAAEHAASLERASGRHLLHHSRWTGGATSSATRTPASSSSASPWMARRWKCRRTWESTGFERFRHRCTPTTPLARYGWRAGKPRPSRSDSSSPSGVSGSMINVLVRHAEPCWSLSTAKSAQLHARCGWQRVAPSTSRQRPRRRPFRVSAG